MSTCKLCKVNLVLGENWRFSVAVRKHLRCNTCISINRKQYYEENKDHIKASRKEYRAENVARIMWTRVKTRSKKQGLDFDLSLDDIVIPEVCPVFRTPFSSGELGPDNPSLDRINPAKGYVKGNVQVISQRANTMKSNATKEQLRQFANWILDEDSADEFFKCS